LKKCTSNFLVMILSSNDLAVALSSNIVFPLILWKQYISGTTNCHMYTFGVYLQFFSSGCSIITLVIMSLERYVAICHPFYHRTKVTKALLMKCLVFFWIQFVLLISMNYLGLNMAFRCTILAEFSLCTALLFFVYSRIFYIAHRQTPLRIQENGKPQKKRGRSRNRKLAMSCLFVVLSFSFCCIPSLVIIMIGTFEFTIYISVDSGIIVQHWSIAFLLLNSSLNSNCVFLAK
jgi:hypothetical protein